MVVDGAIAADALVADVVVDVVIAGIADALIDGDVDVVTGAVIDDVAAGISVTDRKPLEVCFANCPGSTSLNE